MSPNIALYARVSGDKQAQEGTIESQLASLREYAQANGHTIDNDMAFIDNGVSGTLLVRPALDSLRDRAAAGEISKVIVLCPDRLARKHAHQLILVEEFQRLGVEICFINREIGASPEDQLLLQIQGVISEYEREKILERSRRGKLHKAKQGKVSVLSGAPYGYGYLRGTEQEEARYEIYAPEARVVRRIFDMYTREMKSIGEITRTLSAERILTKRGSTKWERSVVWLMLKNPAYMGRAAFRKTQTVERQRPTKLARDRGGYPKHPKSSGRDRSVEDWIYIPVPALISEEVFNRAKERLIENKRLSPRNNKRNEYLLSGLVRCINCGYAIYGVPSNSKYRRCYYRCMGQDGYRWPKGRVCDGHPVRVEVLDDLVWEQTRRLLERPDLVLKEYTQRLSKQEKGRADYEALVLTKKQELRSQEMEKQRLLDLYQTGAISMDEIEARLKGIRGKIGKTENELAMLEADREQEQKQLYLIEQFSEFSERLRRNLDSTSFKERKKVVRLLVTEVIVDTRKEEISIRHVIPSPKSCQLRPGGHGVPPRKRLLSHIHCVTKDRHWVEFHTGVLALPQFQELGSWSARATPR